MNKHTTASPHWHGLLLESRLAKVEAGEVKFLTVPQLKKRLAKRAKRTT